MPDEVTARTAAPDGPPLPALFFFYEAWYCVNPFVKQENSGRPQQARQAAPQMPAEISGGAEAVNDGICHPAQRGEGNRRARRRRQPETAPPPTQTRDQCRQSRASRHRIDKTIAPRFRKPELEHLPECRQDPADVRLPDGRVVVKLRPCQTAGDVPEHGQRRAKHQATP